MMKSMSEQKFEQQIIEEAHEFAKLHREKILGLSEDELIRYFNSQLDYESWKIFNVYSPKLLRLFIKTVKEDLSKS